jgi:hypothetical protein
MKFSAKMNSPFELRNESLIEEALEKEYNSISQASFTKMQLATEDQSRIL